VATLQTVAVGTAERERDDGAHTGHERAAKVRADHRVEPLSCVESRSRINRKHLQKLPSSPT
jgi:hypothetical protein